MSQYLEILELVKQAFYQEVKTRVANDPTMPYKEVAAQLGVGKRFVRHAARDLGIRRRPGRKPRKDVHNGK
jgi:hypothetical protein